jgi:hypothetical protein
MYFKTIKLSYNFNVLTQSGCQSIKLRYKTQELDEVRTYVDNYLKSKSFDLRVGASEQSTCISSVMPNQLFLLNLELECFVYRKFLCYFLIGLP